MSSFLFSTANFSLVFSIYWISRMRERLSWSLFRLFSLSSSSCSLRRSHSLSLTLFWVSSISILIVSAFSSRLRYRLVLVRVYMVFFDFLSLRSSMSELLKLSTKLMASSWIWLSRIEMGSAVFLMYCGPNESSLERLESIDRSR